MMTSERNIKRQINALEVSVLRLANHLRVNANALGTGVLVSHSAAFLTILKSIPSISNLYLQITSSLISSKTIWQYIFFILLAIDCNATANS